jgi:hypothetical protein
MINRPLESRPGRRLHASTCVVLLFTAAVLFLLNVPGQRRVRADGIPVTPLPVFSMVRGQIEHGWPLAYVVRDDPDNDLSATGGHAKDLWSLQTEVLSFSPVRLAGNLAIAAALLLSVGVAFEWRRRRRATIWQLSVLDLLALIALVAGATAYVIGGLRDFEHEQGALREMRLAADDDDRSVSAHSRAVIESLALISLRYQHSGPHWLRSLVGDRWPVKFDRVVWVTAGTNQIQVASKLTGLRGLELYIDSREEHFAELSRLSGLEALAIDFNGESPGKYDDRQVAAMLTHASQLPRLETLCVTANGFGDRSAEVVSRFPRLWRLLVEPCVNLTDDGLAALSRCPTLEVLDVSAAAVTDVSIRRLRVLPRLRILKLPCTTLNTELISELKAHPCLAELHCSGSIAAEDISHLAELPHLRRLRFVDFLPDTEGRAALKRLEAARPDVKVEADYVWY